MKTTGFVLMMLIDSHCHLDDDRFDADRDRVIERARQSGVCGFIVPATTANRWDKVRQVVESCDGAFAAYGLHPMFLGQHQAPHLRELDEWLDREQPVAVGECGLDYYQSRRDEKWQRQLFTEQLQLAINHRLPVIVHVRKAMDEVIGLLRRNCPSRGGVIHSFAGSRQQAGQLLDLGFRLGIAATVGFERAKKLRAVVAGIDSEALLLESDAPDQPGQAHRGERNEPAFVVEHFDAIARLREMSPPELAAILYRNSCELFSLEDSGNR